MYEWEDNKVFAYIKIVLGIMAMVLLVLGLNFLMEGLSETKQVNNSIDSVITENGINGTFILGTGTLNSEPYFLAYEVQDDGGKILRKYDSENVTIYENLEHGETPYVEKTVTKIGDTVIKCNLYVPKDTIKKEVNVDLSNIK